MTDAERLMFPFDGGDPAARERRSLADSMIAGRRKPAARTAASAATGTAAGKEPTEASPAAPKPRTRRRAAATTAEESPATTAAAAPSAAPESDAAEAKPTRTRRRTTKATAAAPAEAVTTEPVAPAEEAAPKPRRRRAAAAPVVPDVPDASAPTPEAIPGLPTMPEPSGDPVMLAQEVARLRALAEGQRVALAEIRAGLLALGQQVDKTGYRPRVAIFVDVPNLMYGVEAGRTVHMGRLLEMLRDGRHLVRATAYSPISDDPREPVQQQKFVAPFVPYEYRIVTKPLKRFQDGSIKGNFDVEMAIDMVGMCDRIDIMAIVSGDADFARAVEAVQARGVRVEVVAFLGSTSLEMRALADRYVQLDHVADRITQPA